MDGSPYWPYVTIVLLLICSAFFSGSEIAYASVNKMRLKRAAEAGQWRPRLTYSISEQYDKALSTILIGNNLVNIAASAMATVIALDVAGAEGAAYATVIMTILILTFGEIVPKILAKEHSDDYAEAVSPILRLLMILLAPVIWIVGIIVKLCSKLWGGQKKADDSITEEDLVSIIETVEDEGVIDEDRSELLQSAIEFSEITAQEIITPRVDVLAFDIEDDMDQLMELVETSPYSRIPVYENTIDNVIGVLYLNHLLKKLVDSPKVDVRELLMTPCFVHKTMTLPAVLAELKRQQTHLAVVTDEYGGTLGILTMEDVLEQLVGDIWDETDEIVREFTSISPDMYEVSGDLGIYDFFEYVDVSADEDEMDYASVGGWATEMLRGYAREGDSFSYKNLHITVVEVDDLRITRLHVQVLPKAEEEDY